MIARKVANDRLGLTERDLPLDNLDNNIRVADALFTPWPEADAYVGNPPFLGGKHMRLNLGDEYVERVFKRFPEVRDSVDFCTYWFRLAQENIKSDGRAGLVATNSIRHLITQLAPRRADWAHRLVLIYQAGHVAQCHPFPERSLPA
jgi:hypothetical protein